MTNLILHGPLATVECSQPQDAACDIQAQLTESIGSTHQPIQWHTCPSVQNVQLTCSAYCATCSIFVRRMCKSIYHGSPCELLVILDVTPLETLIV
eukprot:3298586-Amphidinium_carterae.1